jgi:hypothetical protein
MTPAPITIFTLCHFPRIKPQRIIILMGVIIATLTSNGVTLTGQNVVALAFGTRVAVKLGIINRHYLIAPYY